MKKLIMLAIVSAFFFSTGPAMAAPFNAEGNPQIVANHETGEHGIPGDSTTHVGRDVVMMAGNSGNVHQWFEGTHDGHTHMHGHHSLWKLSPDKECKSGEFEMMSTPDNFWGDYLEQGVRYCIRTNDYMMGH